MSLVLYYAPGACSGVTITAMIELGLECEFKKVDLASGEQKTPAYQQINPYGKVPAVTVDGQLLTENPAILIYLNSLATSSKLMPDTDCALQRSQYYSDLMWLSSSVHPSVRHVCMPSYYTQSSDTDDVVAKGIKQLILYFTMANQHLQNSTWWYGEQWSIFDTYLHWCYTRALRGGFALDSFPALLSHQQRLEARPSFAIRQQIEQR
ncbi:hypothetical protein VHA01S_058_00170 [Vibrio halioticoli NBRC 102217]|uniref:Glutathione S-transferase n=1 Tax=Vibrio halioticoli NBRC 102217 TaxID=1219072 RepID=V5FGM5_9VIBR|nr:glutathione S-transferase family protein [Vibrio halioticoli]GAD90863.1 hypothetical protein VHA01S_058_00170 [Vibrio halioticoli NBRC 102217]